MRCGPFRTQLNVDNLLDHDDLIITRVMNFRSSGSQKE